MRAVLLAQPRGLPSGPPALAPAPPPVSTPRTTCFLVNQRSPNFSSANLLRPSQLISKCRECWLAMTSAGLSLDGVKLQRTSANASPLPAFAVVEASVPSSPSTPSTPSTTTPPSPSLLVFSGGTAFNGVVEELKKFTTRVAHVLPVSDDGGSTAEIVRVLGGPAVGDIRSRCLRLSDESTPEASAVKTLLGYRLSLNDSEAKAEWYEIVEGKHSLWRGVSGPYRETIRAFLVHFQIEILRQSALGFSFSNGSIGNFFFAGARIFLQSLEAAIFLYSRVCQCPTESLVLPAICTNDRLTLGAELHDGTIIRGQNEISHPPAMVDDHAVTKVKHACATLSSPIKRIFYMSSEQSSLTREVHPQLLVFPVVNSDVLEQLEQVDAIVYGMGSLYTSICPSLVLRGVGEIIARRTCPKVLILNGSHDRETINMAASDFVRSLGDALNHEFSRDTQHLLHHRPCQYINAILVPRGGEVPVDCETLGAMYIRTVIEVDSIVDEDGGVIYHAGALINTLENIVRCHLDSQ